MASAREYYDAAAIAAGVETSLIEQVGITVTQIENRLPLIPDPPAPPVGPTPTAGKLGQVFAILVSAEYSNIDQALVEAGGYYGIAATVGLSAKQVEQICDEIKGLKAFYDGS